MRWTIPEIILRMNQLGEMSKEERNTLYRKCLEGTGHEATGECYATTQPIYTCYWCGVKFQVEADGTTKDWT